MDDGFRAVGDAEPGENRAQVRLRAVGGEAEHAGDFLVRQTFGEEFEHFELARGKRGSGRAGCVGRPRYSARVAE